MLNHSVVMNIYHFNSIDDLSLRLSKIFETILENKKQPIRGFLPTGSSAMNFYSLLRKSPEIWKQQIQYIQIDEFQNPQRFFFHQIDDALLNPLEFHNQAEAINPNWSAPEFQSHIKSVLSRPIDFALLGLGPNGHVGFHEPGNKNENFLGGIIELTNESYERVKDAPSRNALTFGAGAFLKADHIILVVTGDGKKEIFKKFLSCEPTSLIPATLLKNHPNFTVLTTID